jgi:hypothetical protein
VIKLQQKIPGRKWLLVLAIALTFGCQQRVAVTGASGQTRRLQASRPPYLSWQGEPRQKSIPGTGISFLVSFEGRALGQEYDICSYRGRWYWPHKKGWYISRYWRGPWKKVRRVPSAFLKIPASHPRHRIARAHPNWSGK